MNWALTVWATPPSPRAGAGGCRRSSRRTYLRRRGCQGNHRASRYRNTSPQLIAPMLLATVPVPVPDLVIESVWPTMIEYDALVVML